MHHRSFGLAAGLALGLLPLSHAQGEAGPSDAKALVAASTPVYRSAFADYQPFREIAPGDWRRLNDTVGQAALRPGAAAASASAPAPMAASPVVPATAATSRPGPQQPMPAHHPRTQGGRP